MAAKKNIPELRFKGFEGEWEIYEIKKIADRYDNLRVPITATDRKPGNTPYYGANGIQDYVEGYTHDGEYILVAEDGANDFKDYPVQYVNGKIWVNNHTHVLQGKANIIDNKFLRFAISQTDIEPFLVGGGRAKLNAETMMKIEIVVSRIFEEQTQIGTFFQNLDSLISLQQSKYNKLLTMKKAMLEKMFPKEGADVPEIRFKGFEGKWEKKKFGEIFMNLSNSPLSRANLNYNFGIAKNIHYGDILIKFGELLDVKKSEVPFITDDLIVGKYLASKMQNGDIIFADAAEDYTVGKCTELMNVGAEIIISGLHTIPVRPLISYAKGYLGYFLNSSLYHNQLLRLIQGSKVSSISKTAIKDTIVFYPNENEEQAKIGTFFQTLDTLISEQQKQLEKLKNIKKACLEKMFV